MQANPEIIKKRKEISIYTIQLPLSEIKYCESLRKSLNKNIKCYFECTNFMHMKLSTDKNIN